MIFIEFIGVGLLGGAVLIILAKFAMAKVLQRDENYYRDKYDDTQTEVEEGGDNHV